MKLEPMNPLPPVTSSFTSLPARHFPDLGARVVPRQPALVAHRRLGREMDIGEIDDPAGRRREVPHAVRDPWRNAHEAGGAGAEGEPHARAFGLRALSRVDQDQEHPVGRRHVPDIGLALMEVERLDRPGLDLAGVDLPQGEAGDRLRMAVRQTRQLGHASPVVGESLELDDLDAVDGGCRAVGLDPEGALGGGREVHRAPRSYGSDSTRRNRFCPYELSFIGRAMRSTSSAVMYPIRNAISSTQATMSPCRSSMVWIKVEACKSASWVPVSSQAIPRPSFSTWSCPRRR